MPPTKIVVMGVSACGKSTVGRELAQLWNAIFVDADDLHSEANVATMAAGVPLSDDDRWPWLDDVGRALAGSKPKVIACSALRRAYRDRIRIHAPDAFFVHLDGSYEALLERAESRVDHFMPPELLQSQLDTLEPLADDEWGMVIDSSLPLDQLVGAIADGSDAAGF